MGSLATAQAQMEEKPHLPFFFLGGGGGRRGMGVIPCDYQHYDLTVPNFMENSLVFKD